MELQKIGPIKNVVAIVNPASGGAAAPLRELNEALAPFRSEILVTQAADDALRFGKEAVSRGVDLVIAFGGDGTLSQVLDGLAGSGIPLLVLRGGTGNLIADELGLPSGIPETLGLLEGEFVWTRSIDLGWIDSSTSFVLRCGCGLEVSALRETDSEGKFDWGKWAYAGGLLKASAGQEPIDFRIWIDDADTPIIESGVALTIANAGRIGVGNLQIAPTVSMSDGWLDVCLIEKAAWTTVMDLISSNVSGTAEPLTRLDHSSLIRVQKARRIRVETGSPVEYQVDGDVVGMTPFEIEVRPSAARVVMAHPLSEEGPNP